MLRNLFTFALFMSVFIFYLFFIKRGGGGGGDYGPGEQQSSYPIK